MPLPTESERESDEVEDELPALQADRNGLKHPDILMWFSNDDAGRVHTPPAHLSARFYRSASNRRRSSQASSRRNSLSSTHSHHSNRSYRKSLHNNHVAQHLRRASIIESRKARLADKAAHAEQVRLRAALAKSTPRLSNSEEKTLAAQQAREKYLAKVASTCADEVQRAKRVAEENKEKRAAEERRRRLELEEKHAEAEERRLEYKRTNRRTRTTSCANVENKKAVESVRREISENTAATRIQRAWRLHRQNQIVKDFSDLGISVERIENTPFHDAAEILANEQVITCTRKMMALVDLDPGSEKDNSSVRTFLSTFMILGHPSEIFSRNEEQEKDLIDKANELMFSFGTILSEMRSSTSYKGSATHFYTLSQSYATYLTAFHAWKSRDASVLIDTMIDQFVAFDAIWQTVKDDTRGEVAEDYKEAIRNNQVQLLSKIKRLAGSDRASFLIKKAIRESRQAKRRRAPPGDIRPREVEPASGNVASVSNNAASAIRDQETGNTEFELGDLSKVFSIVPPNRVLVHELLVDPSYKIEVSPHSDVRSALNREICDSMRRAVEEGRGDVWTVAVAENIRKRLLKLLKPGNSMHQLLSEVLDPDLVRNQSRQGLFSYEKFFEFMADILPRLCAPVRDSAVKELADHLKEPNETVDIMIEKLFKLLHIIDVMSLDYTNYMVQQAAPTLIREAPGYEQRMFAQDLESGEVSLHKTQRWWRNASVNVLTEASNNDPAGRPNFSKIYARGMVDLAIAPGALRDEDIPETLQLDHDRLRRSRESMLRFATVGAILLTAKNLLKRDVRSQWKPEARRILESVKENGGYNNDDGNLASRIVAVVQSGHPMPASSHEHLYNIITRFLAESRGGHLVDPVLKLLFQRLKLHIYKRLAASSSQERVKVESTASEGLAAIGLAEFLSGITAVADELGKVSKIDQNAHNKWYQEIANQIDELGNDA